ncbi:DUF1905 domain-containing protein [Glycomyces paridis]|uniref:DUF1905 domain-containing protein n=1 Tax=Glycomyces paridis TaxID=2126555 RepID=A0A4S8NVP3_9ACTN|nr:DUF1905 domain-containing protein [Glycomyces paridis]THV21697.1 DUF1905 domain-containing protein [Glycomyces paridis]
MELEFSGAVWYWRGPAPWYFVTVPEAACRELKAASEVVSYGWGMVPVSARIGSVSWETSLWPKDGAYIVPLKADVRRRTGVDVGDLVTVALAVDLAT